MPRLGCADGVAGAADALHAARDRRRRLDLDDEIDRAHVDAELQRRGGDQAAELAGLEPVFDLDALRPRERAVVRADQRLAGQLVERGGQPLGEPPAVDEDERGAVRLHQLEQARMDGRPDRRPRRRLRRRPARDARPARRSCAMSSTGTSICSSSFFFSRGVDDRDRPIAAERRAGRASNSSWIAVSAASTAAVVPRPLQAGVAAGDSRGCRAGPAPPPRKRATSSSGRCVADRPMRCSGADRPSAQASSRSSDSARCAPRLVGTSAWISSMITVSTDRSDSRAFDVSSR